MIRLCLTSLIDAEHHRNGHFAGYNYNISGNAPLPKYTKSGNSNLGKPPIAHSV